MRRHLTLVTATAGLAALSLTVAACGGAPTAPTSSTSTPSAVTTAPSTSEATATTAPTTPATTAPAAATKVAVLMGKPQEFSMSAAPAQVRGRQDHLRRGQPGIRFVHEMVVVSAAGGAASLRQPDGTARRGRHRGRGARRRARAPTGSSRSRCRPGKYVLLCNLPGHFAGGVYANFVVK